MLKFHGRNFAHYVGGRTSKRVEPWFCTWPAERSFRSAGCSWLPVTHPQNYQESAHGIPKLTHSNRSELQKAATRVTEWLKSMGLWLSPKKTKVTHTLTPYEANVGFDFLGFTIRQFHVGKTHTGKNTHGRLLGFKTFIKPSKESLKRHLDPYRPGGGLTSHGCLLVSFPRKRLTNVPPIFQRGAT